MWAIHQKQHRWRVICDFIQGFFKGHSLIYETFRISLQKCAIHDRVWLEKKVKVVFGPPSHNRCSLIYEAFHIPRNFIRKMVGIKMKVAAAQAHQPADTFHSNSTSEPPSPAAAPKRFPTSFSKTWQRLQLWPRRRTRRGSTRRTQGLASPPCRPKSFRALSKC